MSSSGVYHRGVIHLPYGGNTTGHGALKSRMYIILALNLKNEAHRSRLQAAVKYGL